MKKILASLLIFFSVFVVVDKVSAATYNYYINDNFYNYYDKTHDLSKDFDKILSLADGKNYNLLITTSQHMLGEAGTFCYSNPTGTKCEYIEKYYVYLIKNNYVPTFSINSPGWIYSSINSNIVMKTIEVDSNYNSSYETLITELTNNNFSNFVSENQSTGSGKQWYSYISNNHEMIYGASSDYVIKSLESSSNSYYFGENKIVAGSLLPTYKSYFGYKNKKTISFNKQIHSFDIYVDKSEKLSDLSYKLNYIDNNDYTNGDMSKAKLYGVVFYGLKNENGLYHWELLDDCTNWDFPSEYCHVKSKYEQLESETNDVGYTVEGYVDFLDVFDTYDKVRIVARLDNAFNGKISYMDKNNKISSSDLDINYFGFDYARNINQSEANRYVIFTTKEQDLTDNMFIVSPSEDIFVDYFDTKEASFREYTRMRAFEKNENTYIFNYTGIGLKNNLGFYILTDKNRTENLKYNFYIKPHLYFSFNNSNTLEDTIYIDNEGNIVSGDIAITPDELVGYKYDSIDDLFENIEKFNEKINTVSEKIHEVIQYAYDSLNNDIKAFLLAIFTVILVSGTIILIRR